ncbi:DUF3872 domain-containing protein (plasmid) [Aquimarina sp. TRL1]|uniref:TraQ conjugal transfer family protein n=1 Tax=Aquimarina sp. (strain TRL1) TaxID=2736252 RepID=UPI0015889300|nr:TraQ conjugal transfer family protein [Aquimarina sp. TRL1]QKX07752.1 DUF3872 domain-containing protein [Aquimarina sp. TRL1]
MKNTIKILGSTLVVLMLLFACTKDDIEVHDEFDFTVERILNDTIIINYAKKTDSKIIPDRLVSSNKYLFKYEVLSGEGKYQNIDGEAIPENEFIELESLDNDFYYLSSEINTDKVRETYKLSSVEKVIDISYKVEHNEYTLEASTGVNNINVNESRPISISLFNTGEDKNVTYKRAFYIIQGEGEIMNADESEEIPQDSFEEIEQGTFNYNLKFSEFGESKFVVSTKDSNGQVKNDTLVFDVKNINFSFTGAADPTTVFVDQSYDYNFILNEDQGNGGTYKARFVVEEGDVQITNNGSILSAGTLYNVVPGNYSWKGSSSSEQTSKVRFFVRDQGGNESSVLITVNVVDGSFLFDAIPTSTEIEVGNTVTFNSIITENGPSGAPYSLVYSTTGSSTLKYNGTTYSPGQVISNITNLTFALQYTGNSEGLHTIQYILKDKNDNPIQIEKKITFINTNFTFTAASTSSTAFVNECTNQNLRIEGLESLTYTMIWTADVSGVFIYNGTSYTTNTPIVVRPGNFTGCFKATTGGNSNLEFVVTASNGKTEKSDVDLVINTFSYSIGIPENVNIVAGNRADFQFNYTASNTNVDAKLFYTVDDSNGKIKRQSNTSQLPSPYTLPQGNTALYLDYSQSKTYTITWTYINNLGYDDTYKTKVNISDLPYSLGITASNEVIYDDQTVDLTLSVNASADIQNYRLVSYTLNSGNGTLKYNGANVGSNFPLPSGTTTFTFDPSSDEDLDIKFVVEDDFGQRKEISKKVSIKNALGEFSASGGTYSYTTEDPRTGRKTYFYHYEIRVGIVDSGSGGGFSKLRVYDSNDNFLFEQNFGNTQKRLERICSIFNNPVSCVNDSNSPPITYIVRAINQGQLSAPKTVIVDP